MSILRWVILTGYILALSLFGAIGTAYAFQEPPVSDFAAGYLYEACGALVKAQVGTTPSGTNFATISIRDDATQETAFIGTAEPGVVVTNNTQTLRSLSSCFQDSIVTETVVGGPDFSTIELIETTITGTLDQRVTGQYNFTRIATEVPVKVTIRIDGGPNGPANPTVSWALVNSPPPPPPANTAPTANAGPDKTVREGLRVVLNGTRSSDPDDDPLTYRWTQISGIPVTLLDDVPSAPRFAPPIVPTNTPEVLSFQLIVNDGLLDSAADTVNITITNENQRPVTDAGPDQVVNEGATVTLDGTASADPDPDADGLTYAWTQTAGTLVTLSRIRVVSPTFVAPILPDNTPEVLTFELVTTDRIVPVVEGSIDTVNITVRNLNDIPVANAGPDQVNLTIGTAVTLDGADSSDADGDDLTYQWTQTAGPSVILENLDSDSPGFTVPNIATNTAFIFSLIVNDGIDDSIADEVSIFTVETTPPTVEITGVPGTTNAIFTANFTFSEDVSGFALDDLVLGNASASEFNGSGAIYTALITPLGDGVSTIDIPAGIAQDAAGNDNLAAAQMSTTFDATAPTVVLSGVPANVRGPFELTINFLEPVTGLTLAGVNVENGTASGLVAASTQVYTVTIIPTSNGAVTMNLAAGAAQDAAGNDSEASNTVTTDFVDENFVRTRTTGIIKNFIARRADQITLNDPDLAGRLLDQGTDGRLSGQAERRNANISFSGKASGEDAMLDKVIGADAAAKLNMWVEASFVSISAETADNDLALVHAGVDYRVSEDTLIGVMGQYDRADERDDVMIGPMKGTTLKILTPLAMAGWPGRMSSRA